MATTTWTGLGGDNAWFNPANWDNGVPTAADTAIIDGVFVVDLGAAASVGDVVLDGGATLNLRAAGILSVAGTLSVGATGILNFDRGGVSGGTLDLALGAQVTVSVTATSNLENVLDGVTVTGQILTVAPGARLTLANGTTGVNLDDVQASVESSVLTLRDDDGPVTLSQTLSMSKLALTAASPVLAPDPNFIVDATGVLRGSGAVFSEFPGFSGQVRLLNQGLIESDLTGPTFGDAFLNIVSNSFTNAGTMRATEGTFLRIGNPEDPLDADHVFTNLSGGTLTGGIYDVLSDATLSINGAVAPITTLAAQISLTGPTSHFQVNGADLETSLTTLSEGGQLNLFFGHDFAAANALTISGFLNLQGSDLATAGGLTVTGTGFIGGYGMITADIVNNGAILAAGVPTDPTLALVGDISGAGFLDIGGDSILSLSGAVTSGGVRFDTAADAEGTLRIAQTGSFQTSIAGFAAGDIINLVDEAATSAALDALNPQELDLFVGGTVVASLQLVGDYAGVTFATANDGSGGTRISVGPQLPVAFYNGVLEVFGPNAYDYTQLFPALAAATSEQLVDLGNGRQQYIIDYASGVRAVFEGAGLTLGGGAFDPAGGVVDKVEVFDSSIGGQPLLLARFSSDIANDHVMWLPFDSSLKAGLIDGGPAFYQQLLFGNNRIIGSASDDILTDDLGNNHFDGAGGFNTLLFGPKVTEILSVTIGAEPFTGSAVYVADTDPLDVWESIQYVLPGAGPKKAADAVNEIVETYNETWENLFPPSPPSTATPVVASGDPHFVTFDGVYYYLQAMGEFVLMKATDGSPFEIQVRLSNLGVFDTVTVIAQVGLRMGGQRVTFDASEHGGTIVRVDGTDIGASLSTIGSVLAVDGGQITRVAGAGQAVYEIAYDNGELVRVFDTGNYLNVRVDEGPNHPAGTLRGIAGTNDDDQTNEYTLPDGTVLALPLSITDLYGTFANAWRVTDATSLLDYGPGETTASFTDLDFPAHVFALADLPDDVLARANQLALQAGITDPTLRQVAVYDYIVTGSTDAFTSTANLEQEGFDASARVLPTGGGAAASALGVSALLPVVTESATGTTTVSFQVYRTGDTTDAVTVDFAVQAPGGAFFDAADFGGVLPTGQVTIPAGAASATFSVDIANAAITLAEERLRVEIDGPLGVFVMAPTVDVSVINNGAAPGIAAEPLFIEFVDGASLARNGDVWTLDLGSIARGASVTPLSFAVANGSAATGNFLSGAFDALTTAGFTVSDADAFLKLAAGGVGGGFNVSLDTSVAGQFTQTVTLQSSQGNRTGFSATLPDQVLVITANIVAPNSDPIVAAPVLAGAAEDSGLAVVGLLAGASDPDNDTLHVANLTGLVPGVTLVGDSLHVDTGNAAFQRLAAGAPRQIAVSYDIVDGNGGSVAQTATFTVTGVNDAAAIGGAQIGAVTEDGTLTASGALTVADLDTGEAGFQAGTLAGVYGSLALNAAGAWTYTLNNAHAAVQALNAGQTLTDTIAVQSVDGTTANIILTINGASEPAVNVINGTNRGEVIAGTAGDDLITPLGGADLVRAGAGNDVIKATINDGSDAYEGGAGSDTIDYRMLTQRVEVTLSDLLGGSGIATGRQIGVDGLLSIENVVGGQAGDRIVGNGQANRIAGGAGNDSLQGGAGADLFAYAAGDGNDVITDFSYAAGDRVDLTGISYIGNGATASIALLSADGGATTYTISASNGYIWTGNEFI